MSRFFGILSLKWNSQVIKLCCILSSSKLLVSFRHDLVGSLRFSADAHRHQVSLLDCLSSRLVFGLFTPWRFRSTHLSVGCEVRLPTPRPALPPWPFEPRTSLVRFLSLLCTRSFLIYLLCAEPTPKYIFNQVFWCCCWSKLGLRAGRRLGWGGDNNFSHLIDRNWHI